MDGSDYEKRLVGLQLGTTSNTKRENSWTRGSRYAEESVYSAGLYSIQGIRRTMEDAHTVLLHPELNSELGVEDGVNRSFMAVFDGHGGSECALYCAERLHHAFSQNPDFEQRNTGSSLQKAIEVVDREFCEDIAFQRGYISGSTAIVAYLEEGTLTVANVGDSRAVLCTNGDTVDLSIDHKPVFEEERIRTSGGQVSRSQSQANMIAGGGWRGHVLKLTCFLCGGPFSGPNRVYPGGLSVSRTIGDPDCKKAKDGIVISRADITQHTLGEEDEFLILACDGLWDVFSSKRAVKFVRQFRMDNGDHPRMAAKALVLEAYNRGSTDNISVVIMYFNKLDE